MLVLSLSPSRLVTSREILLENTKMAEVEMKDGKGREGEREREVVEKVSGVW